VEAIYRELLQLERPVELVVVCGRNDDLRCALQTITPPERHRVHLLGYTRQIDELMACADLLVSKPGGLTTSEALARGLPMAIVNPIPGQESRNSDYLLENGAAIKINHPALVRLKVSRLLESPQRLAAMRAAAQALGRADAACEVVRQSLELARSPSATAGGAKAAAE
jgi:processive 1,2-diacylglycerol beta-glucosyltransferase